jgi:hypothetical protein
VTLHLDGRKEAVVHSWNARPGATIPVTATWQANKLQIDSGDPSLAITQSISVVDTQLVAVSVTFLNGERHSETTFKYKKKSE